jgi:TetR/AcrR family transcriptional repressor of mexJK operon
MTIASRHPVEASMDMVIAEPDPTVKARIRSGRPTRAAAAARDERLLDIATRMFLDQGFEATSMDGLAEAAAIGKATLYARYADKGALFVDVLRRRILTVYGPIEDEFNRPLDGENIETILTRIAHRFMDKAMSRDSVTLGRIVVAQAPRFPDLARLVIQEGSERQLRLVERLLTHFAQTHEFVSDDIPMLADLFLSIVNGRVTRLALYGVPINPEMIGKRIDAAVGLFVRGLIVGAAPATGA